MADWLLLRLPRAPQGDASWLVASASGAPLTATQSGPLSQAAPAAAGRRVCALLPGNDVLLAEPEVPARSGVKLQQVVPYALEEHLAEDIDKLHFATGKRAADSSRVPVAVVSRALMDESLAALHAAGIDPECLYADSELLPANPGQAVALLEDDLVFVRAPGAPPTCLPVAALREALDIARSPGAAGPVADAAAPESAAADEAAGATRGLILYAGTTEWQAHSALFEEARGHFASLKVQLLSDGPLALFAQQLPAGSMVNLLQGAYAQKSARSVALGAWRIAALLLLALVGLHVAGKAAELRVLKSKESQVDAAIRDTLRTALPGEVGNASTTDARRRLEQRLLAVRSGGGSNGLLGALQALAQAKDAAPGTSLQSLNFHDGGIELTLNSPDAASLDHLSQQLRGSGWQAALVGGNTVGNAYQGRVQLHAQGP
ncbi:MAG TPA: type II secretion system protein GspL [Steroidobacteraceae bacterium]|jgi:general secretion pathway protein L|nr:type II secretion system protein GspL [Steroidobacteraceae bacterium]